MVMSTNLSDFYRTPIFARAPYSCEAGKNGAGFFRFGPAIVCYGECSSGSAPNVATSADFDARKATIVSGLEIQLPFDISNVIDNLRKERYFPQLSTGRKGLTSHP